MPALLRSLSEEPLTVRGRFPDASNTTLLAETADGRRCVYKPDSGERPLWDFPAGTLGARELATYLLSDALGWDIVPATVLRESGPLGPGMCQAYVEATGEPVVELLAEPVVPGWLPVARGEVAGELRVLAHRDLPQLRRAAILDVIANNADRKGSHLLTDGGGRVWGIDHGLTWHQSDKLRTVLWGFGGEPLTAEESAALRSLDWAVLAGRLEQLLSPHEVTAGRRRAEALLDSGRFPLPAPGWPRLPHPAL